MRLLFFLALLASAAASAQSPLTDRTGFQILVSEFNENGSFGSLAQTEELGGLDSPDHHRFGIDVTALRRWSNGLSLGLRGGVYRYDPVGLGGRAGVSLGLAAGVTPSTDLRIEAESAYLQGRFDRPDTGFEAAALQVDGAILLMQRLPLPGSLDLRINVGPYAVLTNTHDVQSVDDPSRQRTEFEEAVFHGGVQVGAALAFSLLDARLAVAPVTRFAFAGETESAAFSAIPGGGIWVDF